MKVIIMSEQLYLAFEESEYLVLEANKRMPLSVTFYRQMWKEGDVGPTTVGIRASRVI